MSSKYQIRAEFQKHIIKVSSNVQLRIFKFALVRLEHLRHNVILRHKGWPGFLIDRGEKRYRRFKRCFATLSNPLPILNERACNG